MLLLFKYVSVILPLKHEIFWAENRVGKINKQFVITLPDMVSLADLEARVLSDTRVNAAKEGLLSKGLPAEQLDIFLLRYYHGMKANLDPFACWLRDKVAWLAITASFSNVHVTGLEKVAEILKEGKVALISSHFSYADVGIVPFVFARHGIDNVFYEGGENVVAVPVVGAAADLFFTNAGLIKIKRGTDIIREREKGFLYVAALQAYVSQLLLHGYNVLNFAGKGSHKTGRLEPVDLLVSPSIIQNAHYVVPMAVTYTVVPEDRVFARAFASAGDGNGKVNGQKAGTKSRGRSILDAFALVRLGHGYGDVYVVFGKPIPTEAYAAMLQAGNGSRRRVESIFHSDLTEAVKRLVTLTPNNAVAAALLKHQTTSWFDVAAYASSLVQKAQQAGVHIAKPLTTLDSDEALHQAFDYFARKGAVQKTTGDYNYRIKDASLIAFYANTITATLDLLL